MLDVIRVKVIPFPFCTYCCVSRINVLHLFININSLLYTHILPFYIVYPLSETITHSNCFYLSFSLLLTIAKSHIKRACMCTKEEFNKSEWRRRSSSIEQEESQKSFIQSVSHSVSFLLQNNREFLNHYKSVCKREKRCTNPSLLVLCSVYYWLNEWRKHIRKSKLLLIEKRKQNM